MPLVPFGEYLPDRAGIENPGSPTLNNVLPGPSGYRPMPGQTVLSTALTARCQGAMSFQARPGDVYNYAGDATKLYSVTPSAVTQVGSGYTIASDDIWDATQYAELAIFTDFADHLQFISLGGTSFTSLFTSSRRPKAKCVASVNEHIVLGHTTDTLSGVNQSRVWWTAEGNPVDATPSAATLCDFQDLDTGSGWVRRIIGGFEYGLVFQERAITRMTKTGGSEIFQFYPIIKTRGLLTAGAIAAVDRLVFFLAEDGFYACDGASVTPIGANKVDRAFINDLDATYVDRVSFAIDPINKHLWVSYPNSSAVAGNPNKALIYDWTLQRWTTGDQTLERIFRGLATGYTLEGLDAVSATMEGLPASLDSRLWTGGALNIYGFNSAHRLIAFTGDNLAATIETGDFQVTPGQRSLVTSVRPIVDGGTVSMALGSKNLPTSSVTYSSSVAVTADGICPFAVDARYHRARVTVAAAGTWTHAQGIDDVQAVPTGEF